MSETQIEKPELTPEKEEMALRNETIRRIMGGCVSNTKTQCWEWQGVPTSAGYGLITDSGKRKYTHRTIFMEWHGVELTRKEYVCHHCDNRKCCSVSHLFLGSALENMRDMARKGRADFWGGKNKPRGEKSHRAKLTDAQEMEIRALLAQGWGQAAIFKTGRFPVGISAISEIKHGRSRQHNHATSA